MKLLGFALALGLLGLLTARRAKAADPDTRTYEMRTYYAAEGKLDDLHARFRNHTTKLFEKHGLTNVGYFTPIENPDRKLIYFLSYPSREAGKKSWQEFASDPEWKKVVAETEANGKLVNKVDVAFLTATDYSPAIKAASEPGRVFELRTYTTTPGNLGRLLARFRDHTMKLFSKHGMTNVAYWSLQDDQQGAGETLIYVLAHKSPDAAKASFDTFRQDPDWTAAKDASEKEAGGSLTVTDGVKSVFITATDYSPIK